MAYPGMTTIEERERQNPKTMAHTGKSLPFGYLIGSYMTEIQIANVFANDVIDVCTCTKHEHNQGNAWSCILPKNRKHWIREDTNHFFQCVLYAVSPESPSQSNNLKEYDEQKSIARSAIVVDKCQPVTSRIGNHRNPDDKEEDARYQKRHFLVLPEKSREGV